MATNSQTANETTSKQLTDFEGLGGRWQIKTKLHFCAEAVSFHFAFQEYSLQSLANPQDYPSVPASPLS